ncbi:MAG: prepilin-type N-terminal cleavage/methylation domain-containing protein [Vulcanimicrobiota bacterium]
MPISARSSGTRGFTLIELAISTAILLLMLLGCYEALVLARKYHQKLEDSTQIQRETMTALSRIERNLACASAESLEVSTDGTAIRFISARSDGDFFDLDSTTGAPMWQRWVSFYQDNNSLIWKEDTLPGRPLPNSNLPIFPDFPAIKANTTAHMVILSDQLFDIKFEDGATTIAITLETRSHAKQTNGLTITSFVHLSQ